MAKFGYILAGDKARLVYDEFGYPKNLIGFQASPYGATTSWFTVHISQIELERESLTIDQQVTLFSTMLAAGCASDGAFVHEYAQIEHSFFKEFRPQVCASLPDEAVPTPTAFGLSAFSPDYAKFKGRLVQLDPAFENPDPYNRPHQYKLGDLCEAMKAAGGEP